MLNISTKSVSSQPPGLNGRSLTPPTYPLYLAVYMQSVKWNLRYFVPQVPITGKMLNGYLMFSVKNSVQSVKLIELWGKNLVPLHFVISKS